jgi:hypothetical protein
VQCVAVYDSACAWLSQPACYEHIFPQGPWAVWPPQCSGQRGYSVACAAHKPPACLLASGGAPSIWVTALWCAEARVLVSLCVPRAWVVC